jgi:hypothetical protein
MDVGSGGPSQGTGRFWCHTCGAEIAPRSDFTCPTCNGEFIEEIEETEDSPNNFVPFGQTATTQPTTQPPQLAFDLNQLFQQVNTFMQQLQSPPPAHISMQQQPVFMFPVFQAQMSGGTATNTNNNNNNSQHQNPLINMFQQMVSNLGMEPLVGNPGDYVFGNIDNIISHLFESAGDRGPPPAAKEEVERLEKVRVSAEAVSNGEECPVCKDTYNEGEEVLQLQCDHRFHPSCIKEWLARRNTCPVCRFQLRPDNSGKNSQSYPPPPNGRGGGGGRRGADSGPPMHMYA